MQTVEEERAQKDILKKIDGATKALRRYRRLQAREQAWLDTHEPRESLAWKYASHSRALSHAIELISMTEARIEAYKILLHKEQP